jgi:hypothetical protein
MASLFESEGKAEVRIEKERREAELDTLERRSGVGWRDRLFAGPQERYGIAKRGIDKALGKVNPELEEVKKQQEAMKEAARSGGKPGSVEYYEAAQKYLYDNGMPKQAAEVQKYIDAAQKRDDTAAKKAQEKEEFGWKKEDRGKIKPPTKEELEAGKNYYGGVVSSGGTSGAYLNDLSDESKNAVIQDAIRRSKGKEITIPEAMKEIANEQVNLNNKKGWGKSKYTSSEPAKYEVAQLLPNTPENVANAKVGDKFTQPDGQVVIAKQEHIDAARAELNVTTTETQAETTPDAVPLPATEETAEDTTATTLPVTETFDEQDALEELSGADKVKVKGGAGLRIKEGKIQKFKQTIPEYKELRDLEEKIKEEAVKGKTYRGGAGQLKRREDLSEYRNRPIVQKRLIDVKKRLQEKLQVRLSLKRLNKTPEQLTDQELPTRKAYGS